MTVTVEQLEQAMERAHDAGDFDAARFFGEEIARLNTNLPTQQPPQPPPMAGSVPIDVRRLPGVVPGAVASQLERMTGDATLDVPVPPSLEAGWVGMGRTGTRLQRGLEDIVTRIRGEDPTPLAVTEAEEAALYAPLQREYPIATMAGEVMPYVASGAAGPGSLLGTAALSGTMAATEFQPTLEGRATQGALGAAGGALGWMGGRAFSRLAGGRGSLLDDASERMARRGEQLGFRLTPAQRSGSRTSALVEASAESSPMTAAPFAAIKEANQENMNRIAARALGMGDDVTRLTADKMATAVDDIGAQFDSAVGDAVVTLDDAFIDSLADIEATYRSVWGRGNKLLGVVDDALDEASKQGYITGRRYQQLQTMLREDAKAAFKGQRQDSALGNALSDVKAALDDAAERSLGGDRLAQFREAQGKWRVLKQLEKSKALDTSTGNVSGLKLANALNADDVRGFRYGNTSSELYDAARFARMFDKQIGSSGTAERQSIPNMIKLMGLGGSGGVAASYLSEDVDPLTAGALGLALPFALRGAAAGYTSKAAERGIVPMAVGTQRGLAGGTGGIIGGASGRRRR